MLMFYSAWIFHYNRWFVSICAGYPLSIDGFIGKNFFMTLFVITMFFGGGFDPELFSRERLENVKYDMGHHHSWQLLTYGISFYQEPFLKEFLEN